MTHSPQHHWIIDEVLDDYIARKGPDTLTPNGVLLARSFMLQALKLRDNPADERTSIEHSVDEAWERSKP